jgi:hypothetical protein
MLFTGANCPCTERGVLTTSAAERGDLTTFGACVSSLVFFVFVWFVACRCVCTRGVVAISDIWSPRGAYVNISLEGLILLLALLFVPFSPVEVYAKASFDAFLLLLFVLLLLCSGCVASAPPDTLCSYTRGDLRGGATAPQLGSCMSMLDLDLSSAYFDSWVVSIMASPLCTRGDLGGGNADSDLDESCLESSPVLELCTRGDFWGADADSDSGSRWCTDHSDCCPAFSLPYLLSIWYVRGVVDVLLFPYPDACAWLVADSPFTCAVALGTGTPIISAVARVTEFICAVAEFICAVALVKEFICAAACKTDTPFVASADALPLLSVLLFDPPA